MQATITRPSHWWVLVLLGLLQVAAGVVALVHTDVTLLVLGLIFGVNLLMAGTLLIVLGAGDEGASGGIQAVRIAVGALSVLAGLIAIVRPGASVLVLLLCVAFWFILTGITWLVEALHGNHPVINFILGLLGIGAGVILVSDPDIGLQTLADLAGILLIVRGSFELIAGFFVRTA